MPRSRSRSRGRRRNRSSSMGSAQYAMAASSPAGRRSRGTSMARKRRSVRVQGTHTFSRCRLMQTLTCSEVIKSENLEYKFNDMVGYDEFSALFENYRITKIKVTFQLINNPNAFYVPNNNTQTNALTYYPKLWYTVDHDGGSDETLATMKERQGVKCRILKPDSTIKVSFTPMCRTLTYKTSTTEGYAPKNIRLDMADVTVPHYGLLYLIDTNGLNPDDTYPFKIAMETKFYFTCSGVR